MTTTTVYPTEATVNSSRLTDAPPAPTGQTLDAEHQELRRRYAAKLDHQHRDWQEANLVETLQSQIRYEMIYCSAIGLKLLAAGALPSPKATSKGARLVRRFLILRPTSERWVRDMARRILVLRLEATGRAGDVAEGVTR